MKYIALFDWDNTVQESYAFTTWSNILIEKELISKEFLVENEKIMESFNDGIINHNEMSKLGQELFCKFLRGVSVDKVKKINTEFKKINDALIYPLMKKIFSFLKDNEVEVIIISGSPQNVLEMYMSEFNISKVYGMHYEKENGVYTGKSIMNSGLGDNKQILVDKILEDASKKVLFAFGDSISDTPLLKSAKCAFVNNNIKFLIGENINYIDFANSNNEEIIKKLTMIINKN